MKSLTLRSPYVAGWIGAGLLALILTGGFTTGLQAAPADDAAAQMNGYLESGEFGPALDLARRAADARQRDRWLGAIASRQALFGARQGSLSTLSSIADDRIRAGSLDRIQGNPGGSFGGRGGAAMADFDTLINLITSTIAPDSWEEVGGAGAIEPFPTGVYVDPSGTLKRLTLDGDRSLAEIRRRALEIRGHGDPRVRSPLRMVSLNRLEKQIQLLSAAGFEPDVTMQCLAGIYKIQYLLVYPQTGDVVIAGPAGDWHLDAEGRRVNVDSGQPVLQLDDLVVVLRNAYSEHGVFGCAIKPREANLAATKEFLDEWSKKSLPSGRRDWWLKEIQQRVGKQDIEVFGIDPRTHAARVLVEADYRMKLVGMGLEDGTLGVKSYLDLARDSGKSSPMSVLRWWFTLNYKAVSATPSRDAFAIRGPGVKVLSENELLTETGRRVHTGTSDELNSAFARSFTRHFDALAGKYSIYAELRNVFDLALVAALLRAEDLPGQVDWHLLHFNDPDRYQVQLSAAPREVDSVINHQAVSRKQLIAGVSGGVSVDTRGLVGREAIEVDDYGLMKSDREAAQPPQLPPAAWWWD